MPKIKDVFTAEEKRIHQLEEELKYYKEIHSKVLHAETLTDKIIGVIKSEIKSFKPVVIPTIKPVKDVEVEDAVLNLSDFHIGEVVKKEEVKFNEYNFEIFCQRWTYLIDKVIDILTNKLRGYRFKRLWINMLGDIVSGIIHEELVSHADLNILQQSIWAPYVVAQGIQALRKNLPVEEIKINGLFGTHGRLIQKKYYKERYVSWDYVFYQTLGLLLKNEKTISCNFPRSFFDLVNINGHNCLLLHGDDIKFWMNIPYYGLDRAAAEFGELLSSEKQFFEFMIIGHVHSHANIQRIQGAKIIIPSFIGPNEYSLAKRKASAPGQLLFGMHEKKAKSWEFLIALNYMPTNYPIKYKVEKDKDIFSQNEF